MAVLATCQESAPRKESQRAKEKERVAVQEEKEVEVKLAVKEDVSE